MHYLENKQHVMRAKMLSNKRQLSVRFSESGVSSTCLYDKY